MVLGVGGSIRGLLYSTFPIVDLEWRGIAKTCGVIIPQLFKVDDI
jgi:hypothetical protein